MAKVQPLRWIYLTYEQQGHRRPVFLKVLPQNRHRLHHLPRRHCLLSLQSYTEKEKENEIIKVKT